MFENALEWVQVLGAFLSPIIVAIIGFYTNKQLKETKKYKQMQAENEKMKENERKKEREEMQEILTNLNTKIEAMEKEITGLKESSDVKFIDAEVRKLVVMTTANYEYCQTLSKVTTSIGQCLADSNIVNSSDIQRALKEHRDKEQEINSRLYKALS